MCKFGFPGGTCGKESTCQCRRHRLDPWIGRSPGLGNGNPLQYPCLENPVAWGAWGLHPLESLRHDWAHRHTCSAWAFLKSSAKPFVGSVQSSSVVQSCLTLCDPMNHRTPGLPVHHQLLEFTQTHVHRVGDAIQPSHPLSSPSPPALNLSQHQGLFRWVSSLHQVAKVLEFQLQHQSFQWIPRTDLL